MKTETQKNTWRHFLLQSILFCCSLWLIVEQELKWLFVEMRSLLRFSNSLTLLLFSTFQSPISSSFSLLFDHFCILNLPKFPTSQEIDSRGQFWGLKQTTRHSMQYKACTVVNSQELSLFFGVLLLQFLSSNSQVHLLRFRFYDDCLRFVWKERISSQPDAQGRQLGRSEISNT